MAKHKQEPEGINPTFPRVLQLEGGRKWLRKEGGVKGYSSEDGNFDILQGNGYVVLVSFNHEPIDDYEFWRKRFDTVKDAMEYAETM
jgi:hypothetical protein